MSQTFYSAKSSMISSKFKHFAFSFSIHSITKTLCFSCDAVAVLKITNARILHERRATVSAGLDRVKSVQSA